MSLITNFLQPWILVMALLHKVTVVVVMYCFYEIDAQQNLLKSCFKPGPSMLLTSHILQSGFECAWNVDSCSFDWSCVANMAPQNLSINLVKAIHRFYKTSNETSIMDSDFCLWNVLSWWCNVTSKMFSFGVFLNC